MLKFTTMTEVCNAAGVDASLYAIPETGTAKEMADAFERRLWLQERVFNEGWVANIADLNQLKYEVWAWIKPDASRPFGFRLSYYVYDCTCAYAVLGARPQFQKKEVAIYVFKTFTSDYEGWMYYLNLSKQQQ